MTGFTKKLSGRFQICVFRQCDAIEIHDNPRPTKEKTENIQNNKINNNIKKEQNKKKLLMAVRKLNFLIVMLIAPEIYTL